MRSIANKILLHEVHIDLEVIKFSSCFALQIIAFTKLQMLSQTKVKNNNNINNTG